jgi:hypothetical protein
MKILHAALLWLPPPHADWLIHRLTPSHTLQLSASKHTKQKASVKINTGFGITNIATTVTNVPHTLILAPLFKTKSVRTTQENTVTKNFLLTTYMDKKTYHR